MKRKAAVPNLAVAAIGATLAACAGTPEPLPAADLAALQGQPRIHVTHHRPARLFSIEGTTESKVAFLFMPMAAGVMVIEGMQLAKDLDLHDPVARVSAPLATSLKGSAGGAEIFALASEDDDDAGALARAHAPAPVLAVRTTWWGIDGYRAKYEARARLFDLARGRLVWEGRCSHVADADKPAPSMDDLKLQSGMLLKAKLVEAADGCAAQLVALLGMR
jgi:hypothetical protein